MPRSFFRKLQAATLLKRRIWYRCIPKNFAKFLRTPFLEEHLRWLLLSVLKAFSPIRFLYIIFLQKYISVPGIEESAPLGGGYI